LGSAAKHWGEIRATDAAAYEARLFDKSNTASKMWADIASGSFEPGNKKVVGRKKARPTAYRPITRGHFWQRQIALGWTGSARAALSGICAISPKNTHLPFKFLCRIIEIRSLSRPLLTPRINLTPTSANLFGPTITDLNTL
jgi:hypothetical protein